MSFRIIVLLLCMLPLTGCDKIKSLFGAHTPTQKELDAQAIGYACRVSKKVPEACMKENDAYSPSDMLMGWKRADVDIQKRLLNPSMTDPLAPPPPVAASAAPASAPAAASATAATEKPAHPAPAKKH